MIKVKEDYYVGNCPNCGVEQMSYKEEKVDILCSDCIEKQEK